MDEHLQLGSCDEANMDVFDVADTIPWKLYPTKIYIIAKDQSKPLSQLQSLNLTFFCHQLGNIICIK